MNLPESIQAFLDQQKTWAAPATIELYSTKLRRFAGFALEQPITTALVLEYKAFLFREQLKETSIAGYFDTLKMFLKWCVQMKLADSNPMPERLGFVMAPEPTVAITTEEFHILVTQAHKHRTYDFWPDAIAVGWHTALRISDVALLLTASLNVDQCAINTVPKKTKRFARMVEIPIPEFLMRSLQRQARKTYVFPDMQRLFIRNRNNPASQFKEIARRCGLPHVSFRGLRRGAITRWLDSGVPFAMVSDMTGINPKQLMTYYRPKLETKRAALGLDAITKEKESAA